MNLTVPVLNTNKAYQLKIIIHSKEGVKYEVKGVAPFLQIVEGGEFSVNDALNAGMSELCSHCDCYELDDGAQTWLSSSVYPYTRIAPGIQMSEVYELLNEA